MDLKPGSNYCPGSHVIIAGVTFDYVENFKFKTGLVKEYYRCQHCPARAHVFPHTLKCELKSPHCREACEAIETAWREARRAPLRDRNWKWLESTIMESFRDDSSSSVGDELEKTTVESEGSSSTDSSDPEDLSDTTILVSDVPSYSDTSDTVVSSDPSSSSTSISGTGYESSAGSSTTSETESVLDQTSQPGKPDFTFNMSKIMTPIGEKIRTYFPTPTAGAKGLRYKQ